MRLQHKIIAVALGGALWVGGVAAQAADRPASSLASPSGKAHAVAPDHLAGSVTAATRLLPPDGQASVSADTVTVAPPVNTLPPVPTTSTPARPPSTAVAAAAKSSNPGGYDAGGSMSGSSSVSQAYGQATQSGWGCQAALQYLSQHANPQFSLVCPGYAMGHQAMTCYYRDGVCPNSAEIIIADPCPAAYQNEAWNSWHMATGPYDPYGWCSDWTGQQGPLESLPAPTL